MKPADARPDRLASRQTGESGLDASLNHKSVIFEMVSKWRDQAVSPVRAITPCAPSSHPPSMTVHIPVGPSEKMALVRPIHCEVARLTWLDEG